MRRIILDNWRIATFIRSKEFNNIFPGVNTNFSPVKGCCNRTADTYGNLKRRLVSMSNEQAVKVARAMGIPVNTELVVRLVDGRRVTSRSFIV